MLLQQAVPAAAAAAAMIQQFAPPLLGGMPQRPVYIPMGSAAACCACYATHDAVCPTFLKLNTMQNMLTHLSSLEIALGGIL